MQFVVLIYKLSLKKSSKDKKTFSDTQREFNFEVLIKNAWKILWMKENK